MERLILEVTTKLTAIGNSLEQRFAIIKNSENWDLQGKYFSNEGKLFPRNEVADFRKMRTTETEKQYSNKNKIVDKFTKDLVNNLHTSFLLITEIIQGLPNRLLAITKPLNIIIRKLQLVTRW